MGNCNSDKPGWHDDVKQFINCDQASLWGGNSGNTSTSSGG